MELVQKISLLRTLTDDNYHEIDYYYKILEDCDAVVYNYTEYMTTAPIDCDKELLRLSEADYQTCCVLITMLLREDRFNNGKFNIRQRAGQIKPIIERMICILSEQMISD